MPRLTFTLHPDGRIEVHVSGVQGPGCHTLTAEAEQLLGPAVQRERTPEYYHVPAQAPRRLEQESGP